MKNIAQKVSKNRKYRVSIFQDEDASSPCLEGENAGLYLYTYTDCKVLSQSCNWKEVMGNDYIGERTIENALSDIVSDYVPYKKLLKYLKSGKVNGYKLVYEPITHIWELRSYYKDGGFFVELEFEPQELKGYNYTYELIENLNVNELVKLIQECGKDVVINQYTLKGYSQGDYVDVVGFCTKERYAKYVDKHTKCWKKKAETLMKGEVDDLNSWMWGDVYGYTLEEKVDDEWEEVESICGYYGDVDNLIEEVIPKE